MSNDTPNPAGFVLTMPGPVNVAATSILTTQTDPPIFLCNFADGGVEPGQTWTIAANWVTFTDGGTIAPPLTGIVESP